MVAMRKVELRGIFSECWQPETVFLQVSMIDGELVRAIANRETKRFEVNGRGYYCKRHFATGWYEIVKNLLCFRLPVVNSLPEWKALNKLLSLDIACPVPLAYGISDDLPAAQQSFIITEEIINLESIDVMLRRITESGDSLKFKAMNNLVIAIAEIARKLHLAGVNHRDFYLCHFMVDDENRVNLEQSLSPLLYLMDLHRAQIRQQVPHRWIVKDIGGLYFSALDLNIGKRYFLRFLKCYFEKDLRVILKDRKKFISDVKKRAADIYIRDFGRQPKFPW